jgi:hypothetical protein
VAPGRVPRRVAPGDQGLRDRRTAAADDKRFDRPDAKLASAGERLRDVGVSKRVVGWFTGNTLFDGIEMENDIIEGSDDS